jgi:hypothetical protein
MSFLTKILTAMIVAKLFAAARIALAFIAHAGSNSDQLI